MDVKSTAKSITNGDSGYNALENALNKGTGQKGFSLVQIEDLIWDINKSKKSSMSLDQAIKHFIDVVDKDNNRITRSDITGYEHDDKSLLRKNVIIGGRRDIFDRQVIKSIFDDDSTTRGNSSETSGKETTAEVNPKTKKAYEDSIKKHTVNRKQSSEWKTLSLPKGEATVQYESLTRPENGFITKNIDTDGADYIMVIKSGGRKHRTFDDPQKHFGTDIAESKVLGYVGDTDKAIMLLNVRDLDSFDIKIGDASVQIVRIKTNQKLKVLSGSAIDDELLETDDDHESADKTTAWKNGKGKGKAVTKDTIEHRRVESPSNSFFTLYADDESAKDGKPNIERIDKYIDASATYWYGGDDSAYLLRPGEAADTKNTDGSGNGAIMHIGIA